MRYGIVRVNPFLVDETEDALTEEGATPSPRARPRPRRTTIVRGWAERRWRDPEAAAPRRGQERAQGACATRACRPGRDSGVRAVATGFVRRRQWIDTTTIPPPWRPGRPVRQRCYSSCCAVSGWGLYSAWRRLILVWEGRAYRIEPTAPARPLASTPPRHAHPTSPPPRRPPHGGPATAATHGGHRHAPPPRATASQRPLAIRNRRATASDAPRRDVTPARCPRAPCPLGDGGGLVQGVGGGRPLTPSSPSAITSAAHFRSCRAHAHLSTCTCATTVRARGAATPRLPPCGRL